MRGKGALLFLQPWHVRVAEKRDAVRREADDLVHCTRERFSRLIRQPVD
jgi:hypothetical protein